MKKHQSSIKLSLLAAGIAASGLVLAANGSTVSSAGGSGTIKGAPVAQDQRMPVVSLTGTMGDVGFEIFDGKTPRYNFATLPKNVDDAILYIDVDSPQWNTKNTRAALKLARDLNWVVMAESGSWDVPRLHAFLATHYRGMKTKGLKNVAVRIGWRNGRAIATDLTPSEAAVEVGVDYLQTSAGQALAANTFSTNKSTVAGSKWAWFANNAYQANASNRTEHGRVYNVALNRDVVKVWRSTTGGLTNCIVSWRGSWSVGDWYRNIQSQFGTLVRMPGENDNPWAAKVGNGYLTRLNSYKAEVDAVSCGNRYVVTGHSLGGAMAEVYAFTVRSPQTILEAYNPARVGNSYFRTKLQQSLVAEDLRVFCRSGDPVWSVPIGLEHVGTWNGCTFWGPQVAWVTVWDNHNMGLWL